MTTLAAALEARTAEAAPELVESIERGRIRCHACGLGAVDHAGAWNVLLPSATIQGTDGSVSLWKDNVSDLLWDHFSRDEVLRSVVPKAGPP